MKRLTGIAVLILLCLALSLWAAAQASPFSGTWIYDAEKSESLHPVMAMGGMGGMGGMGRGMGGMGGGMGGMGGGMGGMGGGMGGMGGGMGGMGGGMGRGTGGQRAGGPAGQNPRTVPMTIEQDGNVLRITRMSLGQPSVQVINGDGTEREAMVQEANRSEKVKETTKATLKKNKLVIQKMTHYPEYNVKYKGEFEVSDDGNTLTIKTVNSNPTQQWEEKQVYRRETKTRE
jgi:hypothetical protein